MQAGDDAKVLSLVEQLKGTSASSAPAHDPVIEGTWRQIWSQQAEDANPLQKRLSGNRSVRLPHSVRLQCARNLNVFGAVLAPALLEITPCPRQVCGC